MGQEHRDDGFAHTRAGLANKIRQQPRGRPCPYRPKVGLARQITDAERFKFRNERFFV
jgi:hypothetical protein